MIGPITFALFRTVLAAALSLGGVFGLGAGHAAPVRTHPVAAVAATQTPCEVALAYLHEHGNPAFEMRCQPGSLAGGLAAVTCWKSTALGVSCPDGGIVVISKPTCAISYENEASNSWLDFSTLTSGAINGHSRHDASGRSVDPFGECS